VGAGAIPAPDGTRYHGRSWQSAASTMAAPVTIRSVTGMTSHPSRTTQPTAGAPTSAAHPVTVASPVAIPATGEAVISVRGLRMSYGQREALAGLSFDVHRGELFALLGPNGAGKTTTVEILEGYRKRTDGQVSVLGADPARAAPGWRAQIGVMLQETGPELDLTVTECLRLYGRVLPRSLGRSRPARAHGAGWPGRPARDPAVGRSAPQSGPGLGADRAAAGAVPRRAHHRVRPGRPPRRLGGDSRAQGHRHHDHPHHPLHGGSRVPCRPGRVISGGVLVSEGPPASLAGRTAGCVM
jgi:hypothetical protein